MRVSHKWLMEWSGLDVAPTEAAERLTSAGVAVDGVELFGVGLDNIVIAEVRGIRPHPARDKLTLVTVFDGAGEQEVVCGAPNVPAPGGRVVLAKLGARLPGGLEIAERKLAGVSSAGMLCSEVELEIGEDESGILVLDGSTPAKPGTPVADALSLADAVLELDLTPNRPDCLGHLGVARELCALYGEPFSFPALPAVERRVSAPASLLPQAESRIALPLGAPSGELAADAGLSPVRVDIADGARCPRYGAALVAGVTIAPSPFALRYRLHVLGLRAISNVVDVTNLILLGFGQPIHAFDYDKLRGSRIAVRRASEGERMHTLDGQERSLTVDDLLICDGEGPVALAGVMGGLDSEISDATTRVLIECAYFDPRSVRRTSKRTGLHTDSSHRFERGTDPGAVPRVLAHAAALIGELGGGSVVLDALDVVGSPIPERRLTLRLGRARRLLGSEFDAESAQQLLRGIGCEVERRGDEIHVGVPTHRPDIGREVDLIEELARLRGYDAIPTELPAIVPSREGTSPAIPFARRIRELCAAAGLTESINYAFLSPGDLTAAGVGADAVRIINPLSEDRSVMRSDVLPGLLQNLLLAQRQQLKSFSHFELARVFRPRVDARAELLPREDYQLGVLLWGDRALWYREGEELDFYDGKAALEALLRPLCGGVPRMQPDDALDVDAPYLHPRRRARVVLGERVIGLIGELHPAVVDRVELTGRPIYASIGLPELQAAVAEIGFVQARALPRFPAVTRDVALAVAEELAAGAVAEALRQAAGPLCEQVTLFDVYRGDPVPKGQKSLAFHLIYRDPDATLTDKKVDKAHAAVLREAEKRFGAVR